MVLVRIDWSVLLMTALSKTLSMPSRLCADADVEMYGVDTPDGEFEIGPDSDIVDCIHVCSLVDASSPSTFCVAFDLPIASFVNSSMGIVFFIIPKMDAAKPPSLSRRFFFSASFGNAAVDTVRTKSSNVASSSGSFPSFLLDSFEAFRTTSTTVA